MISAALPAATKDLLTLVEQLQNKGVHLISNKENLDTSTPTGKLMLTMIAAINEFERANTLERQREGIAIAKRNGVYKSRKPAQLPPDFMDTPALRRLADAGHEEICELFDGEQLYEKSVSQLAREALAREVPAAADPDRP